MAPTRAPTSVPRRRPTRSDASRKELRVGYVLKMFPRFSETFVLNEILELERQGVAVEILSLKRPADGKFHPAVARVKAQALYAPEIRSSGFGDWIRALLPRLRTVRRGVGRAAWQLLESDVAAPLDRFQEALFVALAAMDRGVDHLHAHFATSATEAAMLASTITGIPFSFTAHAKDIFRHTVSAPLFRAKAEAASFVVTVSDYNRRHMIETLGVDPAKVRRIYNGLDLSYFRPAERNGLRRAREVVAVGRLVEKKGFPTLVEACDRLHRRGVRFRCRIVGDGELFEPLARLIRERGLESRVFLEGPLDQDRVRDLLRRAAVVALPCCVGEDGNQDALPTVLLEAIAVGTPAVSTRISGIPEIVRDGVTGFNVAEKDPDALAQAIERLLDEPAVRERMGRAGRRDALERFDVRRSVAELRERFEHSAARASRARGR